MIRPLKPYFSERGVLKLVTLKLKTMNIKVLNLPATDDNNLVQKIQAILVHVDSSIQAEQVVRCVRLKRKQSVAASPRADPVLVTLDNEATAARVLRCANKVLRSNPMPMPDCKDLIVVDDVSSITFENRKKTYPQNERIKRGGFAGNDPL